MIADSGIVITSSASVRRSAEHRLFIKANDDWQELLDRLQRLCPQAEVRR